MAYILTIDNGTQSVRAIVFDLQGEIKAKIKIPIEPYFSKQPGWAEQEPDYYWRMVCDACHALWQVIDFPKEDIKGVAITTQRGTVINVNQAGKPLRPAITWLDQRRADVSNNLKGMWGLLFKLIREQATINYFRGEAEVNWLAQYQPEVWENTHKVLLLSGYLTHCLTGKFSDSIASQVAYMPFDYKRQHWAAKLDWKWQALAIKKNMLPDLVKPGDLLGKITPEAAKLTGIPEGLPLIAAGADKACEVIGSGCLSPSIGCLSYGTTATINTTSKRYIETIPLLPPYPSAVPDAYCTEVMIYRGFWMVSWFKQQFGFKEQSIAEQQGIEAEVLFDDLVNKVPPGSMGLTLQPYWSPGIRKPGIEAKGAIIGFGDIHTRAHMYRAILEGIAYALREGKERIEKRSKIPITRLRVSGGGSQSNAAMQITADIFGLPAERPHTYETSALGAAIDAAVGLGLYPDFKTAIAKMTRVGDVFQPNPTTVKIYDELYRNVYSKMYNRLQPIYRAIKDITGYPS